MSEIIALRNSNKNKLSLQLQLTNGLFSEYFLTMCYFSGRYPYKSSGYLSEPEPNYDSDYSIKYNTLDRRRLPSAAISPFDDK